MKSNPKLYRALIVLVLASLFAMPIVAPLVASTAEASSVAAPAQELGEPGGIGEIAAYPATAISGTTITYSDSLGLTRGWSVTGVSSTNKSALWTEADVFVSGVVAATKVMTVTAQFSADGTNWADGTYNNVNSSGVNVAVARSVALAAGTSTKYMTVPATGQYLRFKIEHTGDVTPTIKLIARSR